MSSHCRQSLLEERMLPLPLSHIQYLLLHQGRLMDMKQSVDVSRFMLLEATGDSEADCDLIARLHHDDDDDDDDAQSCSYDGSDESDTQNFNLGYGSCDPDFNNDAEKKKDGGEEEEEEEEKACVYYGSSYCDDGDEEVQKHQNSSDSGQHLMDEMEKNRRFWEACLAS
ncbi:phosphopantothenoylcysteine decarboxylase subunit VHS3 [Senna tora]|uniref:Phosphopantothenoylcysteine decarboxylase subunit VHS3 n=1 Tax=Senna tora TaxID=362788 RepID=A0A834W0L4_9FABA|nr:phosphopantothenoylcysteine decarboxylase subunit VHS3 [Senna tora]